MMVKCLKEVTQNNHMQHWRLQSTHHHGHHSFTSPTGPLRSAPLVKRFTRKKCILRLLSALLPLPRAGHPTVSSMLNSDLYYHCAPTFRCIFSGNAIHSVCFHWQAHPPIRPKCTRGAQGTASKPNGPDPKAQAKLLQSTRSMPSFMYHPHGPMALHLLCQSINKHAPRVHAWPPQRPRPSALHATWRTHPPPTHTPSPLTTPYASSMRKWRQLGKVKDYRNNPHHQPRRCVTARWKAVSRLRPAEERRGEASSIVCASMCAHVHAHVSIVCVSMCVCVYRSCVRACGVHASIMCVCVCACGSCTGPPRSKGN